MQGDAKVIDYLNKGLRHELTAINQYWLHYRLLNNWGLLEMAKVWRKESIEEMEHADKFTDRIRSGVRDSKARHQTSVPITVELVDVASGKVMQTITE